MTAPSLFRMLLWRGLIIVAAVCLTLWLLIQVYIDNLIYAPFQRDIQEQSEWLASEWPKDQTSDALIAQWAASHHALRLAILDANDKVIGDSQPGNGPIVTVASDYQTLVGVAALGQGRRLVLNRFGRPNHPFHPEFLGILAGLAGITALVLYPLGRTLTRLFQDLSQSAEQVAQGHFGEILAPPRQRELVGLIASFNNMSRRLGDAELQQKRLIADISHELRSPLGRLRALAETIARNPADGAIYLSQMDSEIMLIDRLIGDMLEMARFDANRISLELETLSLCAWAKGMSQRCLQLIESVGIAAKIELSDSDLMVRIDPQRLMQAIGNLVDNAIAACAGRSDARIDLCVTVSLEGWSLHLVDNGCGIAAADLPFLFDRFYRADKHRGGNGAGLGLSIAKAIIGAHKGEITIDSVEDVGTRVTLQFPWLA